MAFTIKVPVDTNTPGCTTEIHQRIELERLESGEFNRLINASKSGLVTGGRGMFSFLAATLAEKIGTLPPFIVGKPNSWNGTSVAHPWMALGGPADEQVNELMRLSDMRWRMQLAAEGETARNRYTRDSTAKRYHSRGWMAGGDYVALYGWKSTTEVRKFLAKNLCQHPLMKEARQQLTAALMEKPTVTLITKEV